MSPESGSGSQAPAVGALAMVVGPSGAGKDTLIAGAQQALAGDARFVFMRRVVTRAAGRWEDHDTLSAEAFEAASRDGRFAFSWDAHGLRYGVPREALTLVDAGHVVICNGSRGATAAAAAIFPRLAVVYVTAPAAVREARLRQRGRDTDVAGRLARITGEEQAARADLLIDNDGAVEAGVGRLTAFLLTLLP